LIQTDLEVANGDNQLVIIDFGYEINIKSWYNHCHEDLSPQQKELLCYGSWCATAAALTAVAIVDMEGEPGDDDGGGKDISHSGVTK
jgi:hypothetical protein